MGMDGSGNFIPSPYILLSTDCLNDQLTRVGYTRSCCSANMNDLGFVLFTVLPAPVATKIFTVSRTIKCLQALFLLLYVSYTMLPEAWYTRFLFVLRHSLSFDPLVITANTLPLFFLFCFWCALSSNLSFFCCSCTRSALSEGVFWRIYTCICAHTTQLVDGSHYFAGCELVDG
ncbi:hypothetical protein B0J12DRAFT_262066 [Macrophomina phaseolina]|uniref:Uncharacterized protein n=1 Tax=Macrophomina phaseolina TaxID=35725 RepID=A0ABQ8FZ36_9PEZI|nr:hypothetical protein B0J12DRAFT_262066 [Macrophomina phaseolina]